MDSGTSHPTPVPACKPHLPLRRAALTRNRLLRLHGCCRTAPFISRGPDPGHSACYQEWVGDLDVSDGLAVVEVLGDQAVASSCGGCFDD